MVEITGDEIRWALFVVLTVVLIVPLFEAWVRSIVRSELARSSSSPHRRGTG